MDDHVVGRRVHGVAAGREVDPRRAGPAIDAVDAIDLSGSEELRPLPEIADKQALGDEEGRAGEWGERAAALVASDDRAVAGVDGAAGAVIEDRKATGVRPRGTGDGLPRRAVPPCDAGRPTAGAGGDEARSAIERKDGGVGVAERGAGGDEEVLPVAAVVEREAIGGKPASRSERASDCE